jgi:hypothetical protein
MILGDGSPFDLSMHGRRDSVKKFEKSREQAIAARPSREVAFPIRAPETTEQLLPLDGGREP